MIRLARPQYASRPVRTRCRPIPVKARLRNKLKVPTYVLGDAKLDLVKKRIASQGKRKWDDDDLVAPGLKRTKRISLAGNQDQTRFIRIATNSRTPNGVFLRRRIQRLSRSCAHQLHPDLFKGSFDQGSCASSLAQTELASLASDVVEAYEQSVQLEENPIARVAGTCALRQDRRVMTASAVVAGSLATCSCRIDPGRTTGAAQAESGFRPAR